MKWFRSFWALILLLALYLVPVAFHFDAIAALAGRFGAWGFTALYLVWGIALGVLAAKRESVTVLMLTAWPALLLVVTSISGLVAGSFVALVIYCIIYFPLTLVLGAAALRDLLQIASRRVEAQHLSTAQRLAFALFFSTSLLPLAMFINFHYPDLFAGGAPGSPFPWWLLYLDLFADTASFGFLSALGMRFSTIEVSGFLDGAVWWLSRTLLDALLLAAMLDRLRSGRQRLTGSLL